MSDGRFAVKLEMILFSIALLVMIMAVLPGTAEESSAAAGQEGAGEEENYIKWVDFTVTKEMMLAASQYDVDSYGEEIHFSWTTLLAYAAAKNWGNLTVTQVKADMEEYVNKVSSGEATSEDLTANLKYFSYYKEAYEAAIGGLLGEYQVETETEDGTEWQSCYGIKGFSPIAKGFYYTDFDDFGVSREYGYKRKHLGHDMMANVGTPIIAVESGYVEALGWNQYGGWRIGIRSFDNKRYYYYAHMRQDFPYQKDLKEGDIVMAGDVIGYVGRTGYSAVENVNNIDVYHLHFGIQLIFDESQKDGTNQIWINPYEIVRFLYQNQSVVAKNEETREWRRITAWKEEVPEDFLAE